MKSKKYCLFDTVIGGCGIAWLESEYQTAVCYFQLPEASQEDTETKIAKVRASRESNPPPVIAEVIDKVRKHLAGDIQDFQHTPVDLSEMGEFARQVLSITLAIPAGQTKTYGEIAKLAQKPQAARAVGRALGANPIALIIPCHRVLAASGKLCGFSAHGGVNTKAKLLALEGVGVPV